jgi:hypothetical protein
MSDEQEETSDRQERDEAFVLEHVKDRLKSAELDYRQALTSLWLGNGAASLAVLSFIGAAWRDGKFPHQLLWPLSSFVLGLISMGVGTSIYLWGEGRSTRFMERQPSVLCFRMDDAKSPSEKTGLTIKDPRTKAALLSAGMFVLGCVIGLVELWTVNT